MLRQRGLQLFIKDVQKGKIPIPHQLNEFMVVGFDKVLVHNLWCRSLSKDTVSLHQERFSPAAQQLVAVVAKRLVWC